MFQIIVVFLLMQNVNSFDDIYKNFAATTLFCSAISTRKCQPEKLLNCVAASDAFFPFTDGVEKLIQAGVNAIIQPSGSIRDKEIIKLANKTNTVLVFSKTRHFKH